MMTSKTQGWQGRLTAYLRASGRSAFVPGRCDCFLWTGGAVAEMTGRDPVGGWRGKYRTLKRGLTMMRKAGFADHVEFFAAQFPEVPPAEAQAGDVGVIEEGDVVALGIVQGELVYVLGLDGLGLLPRERMMRAFRV